MTGDVLGERAEQATGPRPSAFERTDALTTRARSHDARARTRPDVLHDHPPGRARFPRYFDRARGPHLWDIDGNRYIDFLLGYGPVILGHADPRITSAATAAIQHGNCIAPMWSPLQVELTELLCEIVPGAESALLLKTGSDATSAAVRVARTVTGRPKVLRWGYNGWHDWSVEQPAGVPATTRSETLLFDPADIEGLRKLLDSNRGTVACVVLMPFELDVIPTTQLAAVREAAHEHDALFVLDEVRSGFRVALGGAQAYFDVAADIVAFSKAMANGYAISAITGRSEYLDALAYTKVSSTFFASPVEMAAAIATLSVLRDTDALARVWHGGERFQNGLRTIVEEVQIEADVVGYPPMPFLRFTGAGGVAMADAFAAAAAQRGVLLHPGHQWFVSASHTDEVVDAALDRCRDAMTDVFRAGALHQ